MRRILALTLCLMTIFAPLAARAASVEDAFLAWLSVDAAFVAAEETRTGQTHTYASGGATGRCNWTRQGWRSPCAAKPKARKAHF